MNLVHFFLSVLLAIIGFETAHGGKMLKKLKKVQIHFYTIVFWEIIHYFHFQNHIFFTSQELGYKLEDYLEANTQHVSHLHDAINLRHNIPVYPSGTWSHIFLPEQVVDLPL